TVYHQGHTAINRFLHPDDDAHMRAMWLRLDRGEIADFDEEYRIIRVDGQILWIRDRNYPIYDDHGQLYRRVSIVEDITERKAAIAARRETEALQQALQREKELRQMKSRFFSMVTHDFRNPLSAIQMSVEMLRDYADRLSPERRQQKLDNISLYIRRLDDLLEDVLMLSRVEAISEDYQPQLGSLRDFVSEICAEVRESYGNGHTIECRVAQPDLVIPFDAHLLRRALLNLLSNAVKYSPPGTTVVCEASRQDYAGIVRVIDQGIGIPPEEQPFLFEPFHRASNVGAVSGTGLGLAIVKQVIELHRGEISVHSIPEQGSTFEVRLPLHIAREG
ncbi:MAG: ATP-binding protein, partial [Anaerolineales bacterium]